MERKITALLLLTLSTVGCSQVFQTKKQLEGGWQITSMIDNGEQIIHMVTLNHMVILHGSGGFLPEKIDTVNFNSKNSDLESYSVFFKKDTCFVVFQTSNEFFRDTFELWLSGERMLLQTKTKQLKAYKAP